MVWIIVQYSLWWVTLNAGHGGVDGEESGHTEVDPGRSWLVVYPEWEPGHDDDHHGGQVDGDDVVGHLPGEQQVDLQTTVLPSGGLDITILIASVCQNESSG